MTVVCERCGVEFETTGCWAKYCPDCRKIRQKDYDRKRYLEKCRKADAEKAAAKSTQEISRIDREAAEHGMSYGQYVAREEERKTMKETPKEELGQTAQHKPGIVRRLITQALQSLDKSEVDCKEIGEARGLLTAAKMIPEGEP